MNFDPAQLAALSAVLRQGSFDAAATELNITQSAVSQRLKALEEKVGTPLVLRGAPCVATEAGQRLARHAQEVSLLEAKLGHDLGLETATARIRIAVNADSLGTWIIPALASVPLFYEVEVDDQDHSARWLKEGAVSAAVTSSAKPIQGCDSHALGAIEYIPTASPEFMARWFEGGVTKDRLERAPMMTFSAKDRLQLDWIEAAFGTKLHPPTHLLPSTHAFVDAALHGLGWGMNPKSLVADHIAKGRLVPVIPDANYLTPLYWQVARHVAEPLAPLTNAIRRRARTHLAPMSQKM
ncbi:LysR family transcriptional regulator ArgP [Actibacterium pelagium]|uniref:Transcriptional regulator ArgP n=1 Tax=Actibacterium pelagium TaxID=2029103 RepID=A0A917EIN5_9RHOB|nr:LysR family transcriptional regulator ArgP [Actibacterium pelagium]GGE49465.1 transcriptional regulator ArgP [Actibacterium pelagium]